MGGGGGGPSGAGFGGGGGGFGGGGGGTGGSSDTGPNVSQFAGGVRFTVPGRGGRDTVRTTMDLTSGEEVNIMPRREVANRGGGGNTIINNINPTIAFPNKRTRRDFRGDSGSIARALRTELEA